MTLAFILLQLSAAAQTAQEKWYIPDHVKLQFAGNIGFMSVGTGYLHGKNKLESDLFLGFLPEKIGGDHITTLTGKMAYSPWRRQMDARFTLIPLSLGTYFSYSFGSQFDTILPNVYPNGYYWWASSLRLGGFIGGQIEAELQRAANSNAVSLYYELGSYDLKFISYVQNRSYLNLSDIISLALGVKLRF